MLGDTYNFSRLFGKGVIWQNCGSGVIVVLVEQGERFPIHLSHSFL